MAIVARGLGLPEDGSIVAGGFGTVEVDANAMSATLTGVGVLTAELTANSANAMVATLTGSSTITAELTYTGTPTEVPSTGGGNTMPSLSFKKRKPRPGWIGAELAGTSTLTADIDFTINFDAELEQLLLVGVI